MTTKVYTAITALKMSLIGFALLQLITLGFAIYPEMNEIDKHITYGKKCKPEYFDVYIVL